MLRAVLRCCPTIVALLLVIDQFEELFTLVDDEAERRRFLVNLVAAIDDPHGRVVVVLTLRADSYHRPLGYVDFAARLGPSVVNVLPLTSDELEAAAQEPAARNGVTLEPALLAELLADVIGEPGALPIFQYALTELFDRRDGDVLTVAAYRAMGGVRGALSRRADDLYHRLTLDEQEATRQLFLRLVSITEHDDWGRRRVPASEIVSMGVDVVTMESVIDQLGRHRFLAFDRDHSSGAPTVEVAHEALLWEWDRLRGWIDEGRHDITRRASLDAAVVEWVQAERDERLPARRQSACRVRAVAGHDVDEPHRRRAGLPRRLRRSSRRRVAAESERVAREARLADGRGGVGGHWWPWSSPSRPRAQRCSSSVRRHRRASASARPRLRRGAIIDLSATASIEPPGTSTSSPSRSPALQQPRGRARLARRLRDRSGASSTDPVFDLGGRRGGGQYPGTVWGYIDPAIAATPSIVFAEHEGSFLVGAAAALTSETGTIGFVGGFQIATVERFRAGFEAGARAVDPSIEILGDLPGLRRQRLRPRRPRPSRRDRHVPARRRRGLPRRWSSRRGVFTAAREASAAQDRHVWAIGVDADQYLDVPILERPYVLTSMIKRFDVAVYELVRDFLDGDLDADRTGAGRSPTMVSATRRAATTSRRTRSPSWRATGTRSCPARVPCRAPRAGTWSRRDPTPSPTPSR